MTDPTHSDSSLFTRHTPITGEIASQAAALTPAAARRIADRAHAAFGAWSRTGPNARRARLLEAAAALEAKADAFVAAMIAEVGATEGWARFNVQLAAGMLREAAAVFSQNAARALTVARQIRSGICHVNGATVHDEAQMPFGGVKASGYGRFGGQAGVDAFTDLRWISIATEAGHFPF